MLAVGALRFRRFKLLLLLLVLLIFSLIFYWRTSSGYLNASQVVSRDKSFVHQFDNSFEPSDPFKLPKVKNLHFIYDSKSPCKICICALESALRIHSLNVFVHVRDSDDFKSTWKSIEFDSNLHIVSLDYARLFSDTPLSHFVNSRTKSKELIDAAGLAILYKYGGIYMSMDIVSLSSGLENYPYALSLQFKNDLFYSKQSLSNSFMSFPKEDPFLWKLMENFQLEYKKGNSFESFLTRLVQKCINSKPPFTDESPNLMESWHKTYIFPKNKINALSLEYNSLSRPISDYKSQKFLSHLYRVWKSNGLKIGFNWPRIDKQSTLMYILDRQCPQTVSKLLV